MEECPEVFDLDDEDELHVNEAAITAALHAALATAAKRCPRTALTLVED